MANLQYRQIIFAVFMLLAACRSNERTIPNHLPGNFITHKLTARQLQQIDSTTHSLRSTSHHFDYLCRQIEKNGLRVELSVSKKEKWAGLRMNRTTKQGKLLFRYQRDLSDNNTVIEEFFHVFQYSFYRNDGKWQSIDFQKEGVSNIEYEAKFFRAAIKWLQGMPMAETPSQKGLLLFTDDVMNSRKNKASFFLSDKQKKAYIDLVDSFCTHWIERDKSEKQNSPYSLPVIDTLYPEAALEIINAGSEQCGAEL